LTLAFFLA